VNKETDITCQNVIFIALKHNIQMMAIVMDVTFEALPSSEFRKESWK